jgi:hypothetical protein
VLIDAPHVTLLRRRHPAGLEDGVATGLVVDVELVPKTQQV